MVVYFQCNNWSPTPAIADHFIYDYLECDDDPDSKNFKTTKEIDKWIVDNKLCINFTIYDLSCQYWVTCEDTWLTENFPELIPFANEVPQNFLYDGDNKFFLKYCEENVGIHYIGNIKTYDITDKCVSSYKLF